MTTLPGVDYAWSKPSISALKGAGEVFVMQYFSNDATKNLTPSRAADLKAAGIMFGVVWEFTATAMRGGRAQGEKDAQNAETEAKACGVDGIPIYFACDYDAPPGDQGAINDYLDGCAAVIGHGRVGMYGGYWPLSRAHAAGKTSYLWGTPAWSGTMWSTGNLTPNIMQGGTVSIGGVSCDLDAALSNDFGQWPRPSQSATWQWYTTDGTLSLAGIVRQLNQNLPSGSHLRPAQVLRLTVEKNGGAWDKPDSNPGNNIIGDWVNKVLGDPEQSGHTVIPAGGKLWVLK